MNDQPLTRDDLDRFNACWAELAKAGTRVMANRNSDGHTVYLVWTGPSPCELQSIEALETFVSEQRLDDAYDGARA